MTRITNTTPARNDLIAAAMDYAKRAVDTHPTTNGALADYITACGLMQSHWRSNATAPIKQVGYYTLSAIRKITGTRDADYAAARKLLDQAAQI